MKTLTIALLSLTLFSCSNKTPHSTKFMTAIKSCDKIERVSIMDEINREPKWRVKLSDGHVFTSRKQYNVGDSLEIEIVSYK